MIAGMSIMMKTIVGISGGLFSLSDVDMAIVIFSMILALDLLYYFKEIAHCIALERCKSGKMVYFSLL